VDIGGTWLRFASFSQSWEIGEVEQIAYPKTRDERLAWIRERVEAHGITQLGIGTGGIVNPATGEVWTAKEYLMPDHAGIVFNEESLGVKTFAIGDGHATAWGHACLPQFAGLRVATLAIGTGLGAGFVQHGRIWAGRKGEYPRINDLPTRTGQTYEKLLGGINLGKQPTLEQQTQAIEALEDAVLAVRNLYFPDAILIAGSVGLSDWMAPHLARLEVVPSPFGTQAGLFGAAATTLFPPETDPILF
jgi:N-acetylmannosamine-6-phosphate 2-epimerase/N-acetylmannosamine kinase